MDPKENSKVSPNAWLVDNFEDRNDYIVYFGNKEK